MKIIHANNQILHGIQRVSIIIINILVLYSKQNIKWIQTEKTIFEWSENHFNRIFENMLLHQKKINVIPSLVIWKHATSILHVFIVSYFQVYMHDFLIIEFIYNLLSCKHSFLNYYVARNAITFNFFCYI